ncbi:MAG TPA: carboxypeptidase-like regulatory domain-containing protein, partial [Vicinamibacteria bacterium]|nr:carboxypeptidase-like regulatory domain-containing protein [Vicinamibacteria bacterium]
IFVSDGIKTSGINFSLPRSAGILGVTTDAQTGDPLSDVRVRLLDPAGNWFDTAFTDDTGTFFFNDYIEPGTYFAHTDLTTDYFDEAYDDIACESQSCVLFFGTPISVSLGELRTDVDFALEKPTATCSLRPHLFLNGLVLSNTYEAYQTITSAGADFGGFPVILRARDRVSLGNGSRVLAGTGLVVELAPFDDCPPSP